MQHHGLTIESSRPLSELTTIRLGGTPLARIVVEEHADFDEIPGILDGMAGKAVVLGRGSNILAKEGDLALVLLEMGESYRKKKPTVLEEDDNFALVSASGAMPLPLFIGRLLELGLGGLTGLSGIPGQLGGSIAMNAGSFGHEIGKCLENVTVYSPVFGLKTLDKSELELGYRRFHIPALEGKEGDEAWFLITGAVFRCPKQNPDVLKAHVQECIEQKRKAQPVGLPTAGCIFKNPADKPAGMLLEEAGFRGMDRGGMSFSHMHANFMVNDGSGTPSEAFALIEQAREAVNRLFGISLELEVKIWP